MTLIIGCITKDFGIIAGDTQLSSGDLARGKFDRIIQIKVHQYGKDFMMGILGKWNYIIPNKSGTGTLIDNYKTLQKVLLNSQCSDKLGFLNKFLPGKPNIEATAIYVKKESGFAIDCVTSDGNEKTIKRIIIDGKSLVFNEPFFDEDSNYIENKIHEFIQKHKLSDSLTDTVFLINNIILELIAKGKTLDLSVKNKTIMNIPNSVGGYVTMQVLTGDIHHHNCLHRSYGQDPKVLLDKTTHPFANRVDMNKKIKHIDNLAMLVKSANDHRNNIMPELKEVLIKQIEYITTENITNSALINDMIDFINDNYDMKLERIEEKEDSSEIALLLVDDDLEENLEFYKRYL